MSRVTLMEECPSISETNLGDNLGVDVLGEQQRGAGVAKVVEPDLGQAGLLQERLEGAVPEVRGVDDRARLRGEYQSARLVEGTYPLHLLQLAREVRTQGHYGVFREPDSAPALVRLWLPENVGFVRVGEGTTHAQHTAFQTDVVPLEGEQFALPQPRMDFWREIGPI